MSDLMFIAVPAEEKAEEVRNKILEMQKDYLIEEGNAVVATKDAKRHNRLNSLCIRRQRCSQ